MVLRFSLDTTAKYYTIKRAAEAVMNSPLGNREIHNAENVRDCARAYDCEEMLSEAAKKVAHALLNSSITFSQYLHEPSALRNRATKAAVGNFYHVLSEYMHVREGAGQLYLLNADDEISQFLNTHNQAMALRA
ncbi:MAG: hypothetical protein ACKVOE_09320 [Rickettsiales bacterium]